MRHQNTNTHQHQTTLVVLDDGQAVTSSMVIATGTGAQHKNVLELIRANMTDFEQFGGVAFQTRTFATAGGWQSREVAMLTEAQATLLLTFMRNTEVVKRFKVALVKAFFELRERATQTGAELTRLELIQLAMNAETERLALEAKNAELEPKAEAFDTFLDATGKYSIGAVAKMLGTSQNRLFRDLRNVGVLIAKGSMRNTPYQRFMPYFEVKAHEFDRSNGELGCSYTTYVQPAGIDFIRRKLNLPSIDPIPAVTA